jgi:hypothetical protein
LSAGEITVLSHNRAADRAESHAAMPPAVNRLPTRHRRVHATLVLLSLCLAACMPTPPPPPLPEAALPPPPPPPPPPPHQVLHATWVFAATQEECQATARAPRTDLAIGIRHATPLRLLLSVPRPPGVTDRPATLRARFSGPAGTWALGGSLTPRSASTMGGTVPLGADDVALSRLLLMLSGGMLTLESPVMGLPTLVLPPSGADGSRWFACVRERLG